MIKHNKTEAVIDTRNKQVVARAGEVGRGENELREIQFSSLQLCPPLCDPMDCIVHGILQARILEWVAFPFTRGSSQARDQTQVSHTPGGFFTS